MASRFETAQSIWDWIDDVIPGFVDATMRSFFANFVVGTAFSIVCDIGGAATELDYYTTGAAE